MYGNKANSNDEDYAFLIQLQELTPNSPPFIEEILYDEEEQIRLEVERLRLEEEEQEEYKLQELAEEEELEHAIFYEDQQFAKTMQLIEDLEEPIFSSVFEHANDGHFDDELNYQQNRRENHIQPNYKFEEVFQYSLLDGKIQQNNDELYRYVDRIKILLNKETPQYGTSSARELNILKICWLGIHCFGFTLFGGVIRDFLIRGERPHDIDFRLPNNNLGVGGEAKNNNQSIQNTLADFASVFNQMFRVNLKIEDGPVEGLKFGKCVLDGTELSIDFVSPTAFHSGKSVDFDVNNLQVNILNLLHQRVDIHTPIMDIIRNILKKKCNIALLGNINVENNNHQRYIQSLTQLRIPKMEAKGWTIVNKKNLQLLK